MDVVVIHGYSDSSESMRKGLGPALVAANKRRAVADRIADLRLWYVDYTSLDNQACYEDLAEGLHLELQKKGLLDLGPRSLNFVVHSTGGLVIRQWMKQYDWKQVHRQVRSIVFLAPANFGSPLAHKARSVMGRIAKGNRSMTDFSETGDIITSGLELGSPKQWELAGYDLFGSAGTLYKANGVRGYVITGAKPYAGIRSIINEDGTDGTIVVAGAGLNCRKLVLDFVHAQDVQPTADWQKNGMLPVLPFAIHGGVDHGSILTDDGVMDLAISSMQAEGAEGYTAMKKAYDAFTAAHPSTEPQWQQFYFRMHDDKEMSVNDYHLQFNVWKHSNITSEQHSGWWFAKRATEKMTDDEQRRSAVLDDMLQDNAHTHGQACHYKRFLVQPSLIRDLLRGGGGQYEYVITISIRADSGDSQIGYNTQPFENLVVYDPLDTGTTSLFYENTTTLVDVMVDRYSSLVALKR